MGQYEEKLENGQGTYSAAGIEKNAPERRICCREGIRRRHENDGEPGAQARAEGNTSWYGSKLYQDNMSMEERTLSETRDSVLEIKDTVSKMYEHRQQFTIGQEGAGLNQIKDENSNQSAIQEFQKVSQQYPGRSSQEVAAITKNNLINSHATGLSRVPYDGYKAILHQGGEGDPREQGTGDGAGRRIAIRRHSHQRGQGGRG